MSDYERIEVEDPSDFSPLPSKDNAEGDFFDLGAEDWRTSDADAADLFADVETELQGDG